MTIGWFSYLTSTYIPFEIFFFLLFLRIMSETNDSNIEQDQIVENTNHSNDNDETWSYESLMN